MKTDSLINTQIEEYRVLSLLGRGGMARVYRGVDMRLKRYVAIKVIDTPYRTEPDYLARFEREAQTIAQLDHPNVVKVYRYGESAGFMYIVMQYVEGLDLGNILLDYRGDGEFMEPRDAIGVTRDLCTALDYIHSHGVIHRDIKPSNVMLNRDGRAILADFGLALLTEVGTMGRVFGTPEYIAPEQAISSARAGPRSDLYSLGVILFEMFTNRLPFYAPDPMDLAMLHISEPPPSPRAFRPDLPEGVEAVILKAMDKEPEKRHSTGAVLLAELEAAIRAAEAQDRAALPKTSTQTVLQRVDVGSTPLPPPPLPPVPAVPPTELAPAPAHAAQVGVQQAGGVHDDHLRGDQPEGRAPLKLWPFLVGLGAISLLVLSICSVGIILLWSFLGVGEDSAEQARASATARLVGAATFAPAKTSTSPESLATYTLQPSRTETVLPIQESMAFNLLFATRGNDSLLLVNMGPDGFPLAAIQLGDGPSAVLGEQWDLRRLNTGECVGVWKDRGKPKAPNDVKCDEVGERLERGASKNFWNAPFAVYYAGIQVGSCDPEEGYCTLIVEAAP